MWRRVLAEGLSFALAIGLCFSGNFTLYEAQGAGDAAVEAQSEIEQEDREVREQLEAETEGEYGEEPTDFSWLEELAEEEMEQEALSAEVFSSGEMEVLSEEEAAAKADRVFEAVEEELSGVSESVEPAEETPVEEGQTFTEETPSDEAGEFTDEIFADEAEVFTEEVPAEPEATAVFEEDPEPEPEENLEVFPEDDASTEETEEEAVFSSGDESFGDGEQEDLSGTSQTTLQASSGDDITDSLNRLLYQVKDYATDAKPYKVIIPPGSYQITGTICTYSNIHLYAVGATIKKTSDKKQILLRLGCSESSAGGYSGYRNVTIEGGTWDCNYASCKNKEAAGGFVGFRIGHATNVTVKNVTFLNNLKSHFLEFAGVKNAKVTGCRFSGYWTPYELGGQECIQIDACEDNIFPGYQPFDGTVCENIVIQGNTFENVFAGVGSHSMMFNKPYKNITITGNTFRNIKKRAVWCLNYQNSSVTNNVMQNVGGGVYVSSIYGKNTHLDVGQKASSSQNQNTQNVVVSGNKISVAKSGYIGGSYWRSFGVQVLGEKVTNASYAAPRGNYLIRGVTVKNNSITGPGNGIRLLLARNCTVTGNKITLSKPEQFTNFGIYLGASRLNTVQSNQVSGTRNVGIYLYNGGSSYKITSTGNKVAKNTVKSGNADGILLDAGSNNTTVNGNSCTGNKKRGIAILQSTGISLTSNQVTSNKSYGIYAYKSSIKTQKKNVMQKNGTAYAMYMKSCKGKTQSLKNITASKIRKTSKKVTGKALGGKTITLKRNKKKLGSAQIGKKGAYTIKMKKQKKGTVLTLTVKDKYQNSVILQKKVV